MTMSKLAIVGGSKTIEKADETLFLIKFLLSGSTLLPALGLDALDLFERLDELLVGLGQRLDIDDASLGLFCGLDGRHLQILGILHAGE